MRQEFFRIAITFFHSENMCISALFQYNYKPKYALFKNTLCSTLKKNRSSDNFLIQKKILIFCTKSKIPDSPSMLYY